MKNKFSNTLFAIIFLGLSNLVYATNRHCVYQPTTDSFSKIDSFKSTKEALNHYEFIRATQRCKYAKTKENIAVLKYLKSLKWTEQEKHDIFKLYKGTYYSGEANDTKANTEEGRKEIRTTTEFNWKKLEQKVLAIAGKEGAKIFWKNFEQITNQFTDITKF